MARANPLLSPSPLPFGAPRFDLIADEDFAPAFEAGMASHLQQVGAIARSASPPTFENTLVELEKSGQILATVGMVFHGLASANTNPTLQALQETHRADGWRLTRTPSSSTRACSGGSRRCTNGAPRSVSMPRPCASSTTITAVSCGPVRGCRKATRRG